MGTPTRILSAIRDHLSNKTCQGGKRTCTHTHTRNCGHYRPGTETLHTSKAKTCFCQTKPNKKRCPLASRQLKPKPKVNGRRLKSPSKYYHSPKRKTIAKLCPQMKSHPNHNSLKDCSKRARTQPAFNRYLQPQCKNTCKRTVHSGKFH